MNCSDCDYLVTSVRMDGYVERFCRVKMRELGVTYRDCSAGKVREVVTELVPEVYGKSVLEDPGLESLAREKNELIKKRGRPRKA